MLRIFGRAKPWSLVFLFCSSLLAVTLTSASTRADDNSANALVASQIPEFVSSQTLRSMDGEALAELATLFSRQMGPVQDLIKRPDNKAINYELVHWLGRFQIDESLGALFAILRGELRRAEVGREDQELLRLAITQIGNLASYHPEHLRAELEDIYAEAHGRLSRKPIGEFIFSALDDALLQIKVRTETITSLDRAIQRLNEDKGHTPEGLRKAEDRLRARIIGQPEVIDRFMGLEWRNALYAKSRTLPDVIWLLGQPGTGKDTSAEAFTDALHGYEGAYQTHMYRVPILKNFSSMWQLLGSATGFIGSESFPPFLAFLVRHSNGKYKIEGKTNARGDTTYAILENPEYKGETLPGYFPPQKAVVFLNEFHNWSKTLKDDVIKQALEKGYFSVNCPNGGLTEIYVPVYFVIASNDGIDLLTSREANGQRHGKPMTYEQSLKKWEVIHNNKLAIINEIMASNGPANTSHTYEGAPGISEELMSRIPPQNILLLRPMSPASLQKVANLSLQGVAKKLSLGSALLGPVHFTWTPRITQLVQEYDYVAEDNSRPILAKITSLVEETLIDAIRKGELRHSDEEMDLQVDVETNADRTLQLLFSVSSSTQVPLKFSIPIRHTAKDRLEQAVQEDELNRLHQIERDLKANVFGIDPILERLADMLFSLSNQTGQAATRRANVILITGLSSTGKTETAKQVAKHYLGSEDELKIFDFSNVQTREQLQDRIVGRKDAYGNPIKSEFMKHYDRNNGHIVVAFDEFSNVRDPEVFTSLLDFFREPVVRTFSDGIPRPMGKVVVLLTGNAGQEIYEQIPRNVPMDVQMSAWAEMYARVNGDFSSQRQILERYFPNSLISRLGRNNIFIVPPHSYYSLAQLTQLKLSLALKEMRIQDGKQGWDILFSSTEEYKRFMNVVIDEGFSLKYQGAAIDSFLSDDFKVPLESLLLKNRVPSGSKVVLRFVNATPNDNKETPGFVEYDVFVENLAEPLRYRIRRPYVAKPLAVDEVKQTVTAFHEAGHSLVLNALFEGAYTNTRISTIPGVDIFGSSWVYYLGVARSIQEREVSITRDWVVRQIAVLAAGETAERLVVKGEWHDAGKQNDSERATRLAHDAVLRWGLSERWGTHSVPDGMSMETYLLGLSERQKERLERDVQGLLQEGRTLAENVLLANFESALIPLGLELTEKGILNSEDLRQFYATHALNSPGRTSLLGNWIRKAQSAWRGWLPREGSGVTLELNPTLPRPDHVASIANIAARAKQAQLDAVSLPENPPVGSNSAFQRFMARGDDWHSALDCAEKLSYK